MSQPDGMPPEDRLAVMELIARYARCLDSGDLDGYVANFISDAVIEWAGGRAAGHGEIRRWAGGLMATGRIGGEPAQTRHFVGLPNITGDGKRCTADTYVIIFTLRPDGSIGIPSVASYADSCVKTDAGWRFARRAIASDLGAFGRADRDTS